MPIQSILLLSTFLFVLLVLSYPLGLYIAKVSEYVPVKGLGWVYRMEQGVYRMAGIAENSEMNWKSYAGALILFNILGAFFLYLLQRMQGWLPLNPQSFQGVAPDLAFNTAISFVTNTNWQAYSGESTMGYLVQMLGLTPQNFLSAATGIAVVFALIRGFVTSSVETIGNFWKDVFRTVVYVLLPLSLIYAVFLIGQGVIQNFSDYQEVSLTTAVTQISATPAPGAQAVEASTQILPMGPLASQESIKLLGTNGGGFFGANSSHPYENPTALSNFSQMLAIFLIPAALCFTFGERVRDMRQGWAILGTMTLLFSIFAVVLMQAEQVSNPALQSLAIDQAPTVWQAGGNMEGKETRFGISGSALYAAVTTSASCGAVNTMHSSLMPIGGLVTLLLMQFGEVVFGGVGSGLYGMLTFAILAVFIASQMIGRTPEYLGKKIQSFEMKMISLAILVTPVLVLSGTAIACLFEAGYGGILNPGPHGLSEILYAFSSAANNNGSAFAGLSANTPFYNVLLGIAMWMGRFAVIVPVLATAGSLAAKQKLETTVGSMPTHGLIFVLLLAGVVLLVGGLNYIPALALGPVTEHIQMFSVP